MKEYIKLLTHACLYIIPCADELVILFFSFDNKEISTCCNQCSGFVEKREEKSASAEKEKPHDLANGGCISATGIAETGIMQGYQCFYALSAELTQLSVTLITGFKGPEELTFFLDVFT